MDAKDEPSSTTLLRREHQSVVRTNLETTFLRFVSTTAVRRRRNDDEDEEED